MTPQPCTPQHGAALPDARMPPPCTREPAAGLPHTKTPPPYTPRARRRVRCTCHPSPSPLHHPVPCTPQSEIRLHRFGNRTCRMDWEIVLAIMATLGAGAAAEAEAPAEKTCFNEVIK